MTDEKSKAIAATRIRLALKMIEQAQNLLNEAASSVCPIVGLVKDHERIGKLADKVKAEWHRLNGRTVDEVFELDDYARDAIDRGETV